MIIIFEGCNNTGKTPYVNRMGELTGIKNLNFGLTGNPSISQDKIDNMSIIENNLMSIIFSTICIEDCLIDRMYPSGVVYSELKGHSVFDYSICSAIEKRLKSGVNKIFFVYLTCKNREELLRRRIEGDEKFIKENEIDAEIKLYDKFFHEFTTLPYIEIDTSLGKFDTDYNTDYNIVKIIDWIESWK